MSHRNRSPWSERNLRAAAARNAHNADSAGKYAHGLPRTKGSRAGIGPNKASGHKGGMGRQGSKRG